MAWLACHGKPNVEYIYSEKPERSKIGPFWVADPDVSQIELPKGSIKKLIGRTLSWKDAPVEIK